MQASYRQAHVPAVFGVAVAAQATNSFVEDLLGALEPSFTHTDWIIVVANGTDCVHVLARNAAGTLVERERVDPRASLPPDEDIAPDVASATYLLRSCAVVFVATGAAAPPGTLRKALDDHAGALPLNTPNAGNQVSVFSLPEPAPIVRVPDDLPLPRLSADAARAIDGLRARPARVAASLLYGEREVKAPKHDPALALFRTREVLRQWASIEEFNRDARAAEAEHDARGAVPDGSPLGERAKALGSLGVTPEPRPDLAAMNRAFVAADQLSGERQREWSRLRLTEVKALAGGFASAWPRMLSLFVLAIVAAFSLAVASEFAETSPFPHGLLPESLERLPGSLFFIAYASILLFGLGRLILHRARRIEGRHQDYRLLAEGLRIQFFWSATAPYGSEASGAMRSYVADHIPLARRSAMFWVRAALHAIRFSAAPARGLYADAPQRAQAEWDSIAKSLIEHQLHYGENTLLTRRRAALRRLHIWSRVCLVTFLLCLGVLLARAVVQVVESLHGGLLPEAIVQLFEHPTAGHWFVVGMVVSLVISLSAGEAAEGFGLEAEIRRGEATNAMLLSAQCHWGATQEAAAADPRGLARAVKQREKLLFDLGRLMIDDYTEWFHIHRERPAQPIHG
ncbi:membrane hypothetical protein [Paraburkholderia unamae]|uniref:hypothetical protein n=1 Tax=Paraburkholderia unamae TaxID=219649 RepID=UPI001CB09FB7|nr:hypothetical protein [Paraburkholderia unamae]CAG9265173.1 membrane hypothetical protein [Paraburkholderia unamae]